VGQAADMAVSHVVPAYQFKRKAVCGAKQPMWQALPMQEDNNRGPAASLAASPSAGESNPSEIQVRPLKGSPFKVCVPVSA
jgi:hypothetical protein